MHRLSERGASQPIINLFAARERFVLETALKMNLAEDRIPFLPVIPPWIMSVNAQMGLIQFEGHAGYTLLDQKKIHTMAGTPNEPYFIFDVEDGKTYMDVSPLAADSLIRSVGRFPLTATEAIALCVHTDVLFDHFVDAAGSRYESKNKNVTVILEGAVANLSQAFFQDSDPNWGTASCRLRLK